MPPTTGRNLNYFYPHIREISKIVYDEILSGACCMKPARVFIKSAGWLHRIVPSFTGAWRRRTAQQRFLVNNFADFPECVGKNNLDFVPLTVVFGISNIYHWFNFSADWKHRVLAHIPEGATRMSRGYQAHPKIYVIRLVFQDQALYARTSFRGAKRHAELEKRVCFWSYRQILERTWQAN